MHKAAIIKIVYWSNKRIIFHSFAFESFSTSFTVYLLFIFHLFNKLQVDCSLNQNLSFNVCYVWLSSGIWLTDNTNSTQFFHSPPTRNRHDPRHARNYFWVAQCWPPELLLSFRPKQASWALMSAPTFSKKKYS